MKTIDGRVAAVTGAASGIGRALTLRLLQGGARVAAADRDEAGLAETARLAGAGERLSTHRLDVSDRAAVEAWAAEVNSRHGRCHILVNNAGVALGGEFARMKLEDFEWLMGVNFWGVIYGCRAFLPTLLEQEEGHIVNISSIFGIIAPPGQTAYCAAKFGVRGFTESLQKELKATRVGVSCVHPGGVATSIVRNARMPNLTNQERVEGIERFEKALARTQPAQAAETILDGILKNRPRVLVGGDARMLDRMQRLFPVGYAKLMERVALGRQRATAKVASGS